MPITKQPTRHDLLSVYLNDHLTGASAGVDLFARVASSHSDPEARQSLRGLADAVNDDRDALIRLMRDLGMKAHAYRMLVGRVVEKVGRLKMNGTVLTRSPLTDLVELEALRSGVQAKRAMWEALEDATDVSGRTAESLAQLKERATSQLQAIETLRRQAARSAFAT